MVTRPDTMRLVGRINEWVANPLGLRQTSALQIKDYICLVQSLFVTQIYCKYIGDLKSGLVQIWDSQKEVGLQIVGILIGI